MCGPCGSTLLLRPPTLNISGLIEWLTAENVSVCVWGIQPDTDTSRLSAAAGLRSAARRQHHYESCSTHQSLYVLCSCHNFNSPSYRFIYTILLSLGVFILYTYCAGHNELSLYHSLSSLSLQTLNPAICSTRLLFLHDLLVPSQLSSQNFFDLDRTYSSYGSLFRFLLFYVFKLFNETELTAPLTLWRPLLPYGYSYKASCARPGELSRHL